MPSNTVPLFCYLCETTYICNLCIEFGKDRLAAADRPSLGQAPTLALHDLLASPAQVPCQTAEAPATSCAERRGVHVRRHQLHAVLEARYGLVEGRSAPHFIMLMMFRVACILYACLLIAFSPPCSCTAAQPQLLMWLLPPTGSAAYAWRMKTHLHGYQNRTIQQPDDHDDS